MKRPPLGPGRKDITWRPAGERRLIPETSNLKPQTRKTAGYVHRWVKPCTEIRVHQGNRHSVPNHIPTPGPTS